MPAPVPPSRPGSFPQPPPKPTVPHPPGWLVKVVGKFASSGVAIPGGPTHPDNLLRGTDEPPNPAPMPRTLDQLFTTPASGSVAMPPRDRGDQGISAAESQAGDRAIAALLSAPGTAMVATVRDGVYELHGRDGTLAWRRFRQPDGQLVYALDHLTGTSPISSVDPARLNTLDAEIAAAGGPERPVPVSATSYPDVLRRISQLFDHEDSPDLHVIPTPGGDPGWGIDNTPGGNHGGPDVTQSRATLVMAGPGIASGRVVDAAVRTIDVAPTIAEGIGIAPVAETAPGEPVRYLRGQDGVSLGSSIADGAAGATITGRAKRALMIVLDGLNANVLNDELAKGHLPNIARLEQRGTTFRNGTIAESQVETWANQTALATGAEPGRSGIIGDYWYDRETRTERHTVDATNLNVLWSSTLLDPRVETLYEAVHRTFGPSARTAAINEPQGRGADVATLETQGVGTLARHLPGTVREFNRGRHAVQDPDWQHVREYRSGSTLDNLGISAAMQLYRGRADDPTFTMVEQFITDQVGHALNPQSPGTRAALREADRNVGRLLGALEKAGDLDSTMVVLTSDHGQEPQSFENAGGWRQALDAAGVKALDGEHNIYLKSMRVADAGSTAAVVRLDVHDDDALADGSRPAIGGARVTVSTSDGQSFTGTTAADGTVAIPLPANASGVLDVDVASEAFTSEHLELGHVAPPPGGG